MSILSSITKAASGALKQLSSVKKSDVQKAASTVSQTIKKSVPAIKQQTPTSQVAKPFQSFPSSISATKPTTTPSLTPPPAKTFMSDVSTAEQSFNKSVSRVAQLEGLTDPGAMTESEKKILPESEGGYSYETAHDKANPSIATMAFDAIGKTIKSVLPTPNKTGEVDRDLVKRSLQDSFYGQKQYEGGGKESLESTIGGGVSLKKRTDADIKSLDYKITEQQKNIDYMQKYLTGKTKTMWNRDEFKRLEYHQKQLSDLQKFKGDQLAPTEVMKADTRAGRRSNILARSALENTTVGSWFSDYLPNMQPANTAEKISKFAGAVLGNVADVEAGGSVLRSSGLAPKIEQTASKIAGPLQDLVTKASQKFKPLAGLSTDGKIKGIIQNMMELPTIFAVETNLQDPTTFGDQTRAQATKSAITEGLMFGGQMGASQLASSFTKGAKAKVTELAVLPILSFITNKARGLSDEDALEQAATISVVHGIGSFDHRDVSPEKKQQAQTAIKELQKDAQTTLQDNPMLSEKMAALLTKVTGKKVSKDQLVPPTDRPPSRDIDKQLLHVDPRKVIVDNQKMQDFVKSDPELKSITERPDVEAFTKDSVLKTNEGTDILFHKNSDDSFSPATEKSDSSSAVLHMKNPYVAEPGQHLSDENIEQLKADGYDGAKMSSPDGRDVYIPFHSSQIKVLQHVPTPEAPRPIPQKATLDDVLGSMRQEAPTIEAPTKGADYKPGQEITLKNGNTAFIDNISRDGTIHITEKVISAKKEAVWKSNEVTLDDVVPPDTTTHLVQELSDATPTKYIEFDPSKRPIGLTAQIKADRQQKLDSSWFARAFGAGGVKQNSWTSRFKRVFTDWSKGGRWKTLLSFTSGTGHQLERLSPYAHNELKNYDREKAQHMSRGVEAFVNFSKEFLPESKKPPEGAYAEMMKRKEESHKLADVYDGLKDNAEVLNIAMMNGDGYMVKLMVGEQGYKDYRQYMDTIHKDLTDLGHQVGYSKDYFPRKVKDHEGLVKYLNKNMPDVIDAIKKKMAYEGEKITDEAIASTLDEYMVDPYGFEGQKLDLGNLQNRVIDKITPEFAKFYHKSEEAFGIYVDNVSQAIAMGKLFKNTANEYKKSRKLDTTAPTTAESIGSYVMNLTAMGHVKPADAYNVEDLLKQRFNEPKTPKRLQTYKNLAHITTIGNIGSALSQIEDIATSVYENGVGVIPTYIKNVGLGVFIKPAHDAYAWFGKKTGAYEAGKMTIKNELDYKELVGEAEKISMNSVEGSERSNGFVKKLFESPLTSLSNMVLAAKQTFVDSTLKSLKDHANGKKSFGQDLREWAGVAKDWDGYLEHIFNGDKARAQQVLSDLKQGKVTISDDVKYAIYRKLSDYDTVSPSEMPPAYNRNAMLRANYMWKSYLVKRLDIIRREVMSPMMKGDWKKSMYNFTRLAMGLMIAGMTTDEIKDRVFGRATSVSDRVTDNLYKMTGLISKFSLYQFEKEGWLRGIEGMFGPPVGLVKTPLEDLNNWYTAQKTYGGKYDPLAEAWSLNMVPVFGKYFTRHRGAYAKYLDDKENKPGMGRKFQEDWWNRTTTELITNGRRGEKLTIAKLVKIVDGDTITVEIDGKHENVRFLGIDTPESAEGAQKGGVAVGKEFGGAEDVAYVKSRLKVGEYIQLRSDVLNKERDKYGRLLGYVETVPDFLQWAADIPGLNVLAFKTTNMTRMTEVLNEELVKQGMARPTPGFKLSQGQKYMMLGRLAEADGLGIWNKALYKEWLDKGGIKNTETPYGYYGDSFSKKTGDKENDFKFNSTDSATDNSFNF